MGLNSRGIVSIIQLVIYSPTFLVTIFLLSKYGIRKTRGWLWLAIFIQIKIAGAILLIIAESEKIPSTKILIPALALGSGGSQTLILVAAELLETVLRELPKLRNTHVALLFHPLISAGIALVAVGGAKSFTAGEQSTASSLRKAGGIVILVAFLALTSLTCYAWTKLYAFTQQRRSLLKAITFALLPLAVRVVYLLGGAFSNLLTSSFSILTGSIALFVVLDVIMEFIVTGISIWVGITHRPDHPGGKVNEEMALQERGAKHSPSG